MRIQEIRINGFRSFDNFIVGFHESRGLIVLAGSNGTGKSTVLEIVDGLINSSAPSNLNAEILSGITQAEATWSVTIEFSESDLNACAQYLARTNPQNFSEDTALVLAPIKETLQKENDWYRVKLSLVIKRNQPVERERPQIKFTVNTKENSVPFWFQTLGSQGYFSVYLKSSQQIQEGNLSIFNTSVDQSHLAQVVAGDRNITQRSSVSNIQLGQVLTQLALRDVWEVFQASGGRFDKVNETLKPINEIIFPLELSFNKEGLEVGNIFFVLKNHKTNTEYSVAYASSGERHVIALAATLIQWQRLPFKNILLVDEPEIHLHPDYIFKLGTLFQKVFGTNSDFSCIAATHSPEFIAANPENVYQISSDTKTFLKIDNLADRAKLLEEIGKRFDLSFLIKKVAWVEGVHLSKSQLEDHEVYQKLIDPKKSTIVFLPCGVPPLRQGDREHAVNASNVFLEFIKAIANSDPELEVLAVVDRDNEAGSIKSDTIIPTPFTNLENIFLLGLDSIQENINIGNKTYPKSEIINKINNVVGASTADLMNVDGKRVLKSLYESILIEIKISYKEFQNQILDATVESNFPRKVQEFITNLRR